MANLKFMRGFKDSNIAVLFAGLINTAAIIGGSLIPIPLLLNLYNTDVYQDFLVFMAYAGLFAFSNLMFPQNFSDLVSKCRRDAFPALIAITKYNVLFCTLIGCFLVILIGFSDFYIFFSALIFALLRSLGFTIAAGFSGYRMEWMDKGLLSPLLHLVPVFAIPLHLFCFPGSDYFLCINMVAGCLLCLFLVFSMTGRYMTIEIDESYSLDIGRSLSVFLTFNVTSIFWLSYPLITEMFLSDTDLVSFSIAFKVFAFISAVSTPVLLAFWTRWSNFDELQVLPNSLLLWMSLIFFTIFFQILIYKFYPHLLAIFGLEQVNLPSVRVSVTLVLFGIFRIFSNIGVILVSRYVNSYQSLAALSVAEFGAWGFIWIFYAGGVIPSGEAALGFGFCLSSLAVLIASVWLLRSVFEDRICR